MNQKKYSREEREYLKVSLGLSEKDVDLVEEADIFEDELNPDISNEERVKIVYFFLEEKGILAQTIEAMDLIVVSVERAKKERPIGTLMAVLFKLVGRQEG